MTIVILFQFFMHAQFIGVDKGIMKYRKSVLVENPKEIFPQKTRNIVVL